MRNVAVLLAFCVFFVIYLPQARFFADFLRENAHQD
jgi:hypothetical protein